MILIASLTVYLTPVESTLRIAVLGGGTITDRSG